jgi:hypothetical protein
MDDKLSSVSSNFFCCNICDYKTSRKSQYDRHLNTNKHKESYKMEYVDNKTSSIYNCKCGKEYKYRQGLWKHSKICSVSTTNTNTNTNIESLNNTVNFLCKKQQLIEKINSLEESNIDLLDIIFNLIIYTKASP